jgi:pantoate--beta-alanine ligase
MISVVTLDELRQKRRELRGPVGLVPTMGYLHGGHLSLVQRAKEECASVVVSIFVNPTQFGPQEDLAAYPRDLERDQAMLGEAGVDLLWTPTNEVMYPEDAQTWVTVEEITKVLEGAMRPGHFRGVTTVVTKLFNAVQADKAYFGQKDAQQLAVIRQMVRDLQFPVQIVACPTAREKDGLALSSRNTYLNPAERQAAVVLYRALSSARESYLSGEHSADCLRQAMLSILSAEPLAHIQYVSCADRNTLQELEWVTNGCLLSMAVYIGKTRLIDNFVLEP